MKNKYLIALIVVVTFSSAFAISSMATSFNTTAITVQSLKGLNTIIYYEKSNAPSTNSPIILNTANLVPSASGKYIIPPGASAYLWTPQFSATTSIPSGPLNLDLWAGSTPEINGKASESFRATSGAITLTTTQSKDIIYVAVSIDSVSATVSISGAGLSWHPRENATAITGRIYTFYAISPNPLSAATITATISSREYFVLTAFGISGIDTTNPFDPNLPKPKINSGNSNTASVTFTTTNPNDFIIGALYINGVPKSSIIGSGYTSIAELSSGKMTGATEYKNAAGSGSQTTTFALGTSNNYWSIIGDALVPASSGAAISVSAYTITSTGAIQSILLNAQNTNPTLQIGGQVSTTFSISQGTIPASGYIELILTAPTSSAIEVYWGSGQPTNFQICFGYS